MQRVWQEMRAGWREARWSTHFSLTAFPGTLVVLMAAALIQGRVVDPPSPGTWVAEAVLLLGSLGWAGLRDGPEGFLGHAVWRLTVLLFLLPYAIWRLKRSRTRFLEFSLSLPGYQVTVKIGTSEAPGDANRDLLNLQHLQVNYERLVNA
jgi:hypothetical protein